MIETITTPVGRLVEGSLYIGKDHDAENQPLTFKTGKNIVNFDPWIFAKKKSLARLRKNPWYTSVP